MDLPLKYIKLRDGSLGEVSGCYPESQLSPEKAKTAEEMPEKSAGELAGIGLPPKYTKCLTCRFWKSQGCY